MSGAYASGSGSGSGSAAYAAVKEPIVYSPLPEDGQEIVKERRRKRHLMYLGLLVGYLNGSCVVYWLLEGWNPLQALVFNLSIVTGAGYGHLAPSSQISMLVTSFTIMAGIMMFATIAGQVLDFIMQSEIDAAAEFIDKASDIYEQRDDAGNPQTGYDAQTTKKHHEDFKAKQMSARKTAFLTGCLNMAVISVFAVIWFMFGYGLTFCEAMYFASLAVMKLDSLCTLDGVVCAAGAHTSRGGEATDLLLAIVWCIVTYSTIGHFMAATCNYLGHDQEPVMTKVSVISKKRWARMDKDGDGRIHRADFLRDRLIQGGIASAIDIDHILANFAELDKDKSGTLTAKDVS